MRKDLRAIRDELAAICEAESAKLYRLAWRMAAHGCDRKHVEKCRDEARMLHMTGYPERVIGAFAEYDFTYAFKF